MSALAAIHAGLRQLGIEEEDARDLYHRQTGKRSLREMSPKEREAVIGELRRLGFKPKPSGGRRLLEGRYAKKMQALWIAAWNLGIVENNSDEALIAFVKRQTGIDHVRFVRHPEDAAKAIEALKSWMAREAGVDWRADGFLPDWTQSNGYRVAVAQFALLKKADPAFAEYAELSHWVIRHVDADFRAWKADDRQWIAIMNALGEHIRSLKG
jgi:phage gp16-like protein